MSLFSMYRRLAAGARQILPGSPAKRRPTWRPSLKVLEDRLVPALTFTVTSTAYDTTPLTANQTSGSLFQAIAFVDTKSSSDNTFNIDFAVSGTITTGNAGSAYTLAPMHANTGNARR
jgi:hypothetical protein